MGLLRTFYKNALINSQLSLYTVEMKNTRGWRARDAGFQLIIEPHCRVTGNLYHCLRLEYIKKKREKGSLEDSSKRLRTEVPERRDALHGLLLS